MSGVDLSQLGKPLPYLLRPGEIRRTKRGFEAQVLVYLDRTVIETALDVAAGPLGWQMTLEPFGSDGSVLCALGILCPLGAAYKSPSEWRWRQDVGYPEDGNDHPALSAATNAFKRAAGRWGIGRFLRDLPKPWLPCRVSLGKKGEGSLPAFVEWACDPVEEMERQIAASRGGAAQRVFAAIEAHSVPMVDVARWCLAQGCRDVRDLSPSQRGQLESLIVSGHFKGGANGDAAQG